MYASYPHPTPPKKNTMQAKILSQNITKHMTSGPNKMKTIISMNQYSLISHTLTSVQSQCDHINGALSISWITKLDM